jgi:hypothetical protein
VGRRLPLAPAQRSLGARVDNKSDGEADRPLGRLGPLSSSRRVRRAQLRGSAACICAYGLGLPDSGGGDREPLPCGYES